MVSVAQAKKLRFGQVLYHTRNRNADGTAQRWRVTGKVKTWKRNPNRVQVPIKHGLYTFDYITEYSCKYLTLKEPKYKKLKRRK